MDKMQSIISATRLNRQTTPQTNYNSNSPIVVLLDPGHGGMLRGVYTTAPAKMSKFVDLEFYEGVWNRAVVWSIASALKQLGGSYSVLVPEDEDITLHERVRRAVTASKQRLNEGFKFYFHSVHANAFGVESAKGVEVWTTRGETKSDQLATLYYQRLFELGWPMRPDMADGDPDKEEDFTVLKETPMPALLTETGFYTNYEEVQQMMRLPVIEQIANLMVQAHYDIIKLKLL
jgi:N-acetylmuramoyl-L-alanine amidase